VFDGVVVGVGEGVIEGVGVGVCAPNNPYARADNPPLDPITGDIL
jgi:hypothetical protein